MLSLTLSLTTKKRSMNGKVKPSQPNFSPPNSVNQNNNTETPTLHQLPRKKLNNRHKISSQRSNRRP